MLRSAAHFGTSPFDGVHYFAATFRLAHSLLRLRIFPKTAAHFQSVGDNVMENLSNLERSFQIRDRVMP
jgi:hypothetical protein